MRQKDRYIGHEILDGQFKILKKIGTGGMGSVYKALQPEMNRMVAVKILHPKLKDRKDLVSRFRREARAMSHLAHPNTVKVFMYGELPGGELYIVMEYLEGKNLNQIVRRHGPLPVNRAIPVLVQVCGALQEAHEIGIVHRDLKPENIFLTNSAGLKDFAKVLDFGLAKVTERELRPGSIMLTQEGMVFGTPEFMSPEQAQGQTLDRRSDIYSLAVILYEALTGKLPFDARSSMEFIQLHVMKPPIHLDDRIRTKTYPAGLGDVISRALEKDPEDRYATADEFANALRPFAPGTKTTIVETAKHDQTEPESTPDSGAKPTLIDEGRQQSETLAMADPLTSQPEDSALPQTFSSAKEAVEMAAITIDDEPSGISAPDAPTQVPEPPSQISSTTLVVVAAVSIISGVLLTLLALKLLG